MNERPLTKTEIFNLLKKVLITNLESEKVELSIAEGRILSRDIISAINLPPFNNSAVDGYAVHNDNLNSPKRLKCIQRVAAGDQSEILLNVDEVVRIFTGARMPQNSNTVVMQENVVISNDYVVMSKIPKQGENCRLTGEDIAKTDKILQSGDKIRASNLNLIAAIGKKNVEVKKKLKIGYFTSGNELREPSEILKGAEINNSNRYLLHSLLKKNYIDSCYLGILRDSKNSVI